MRKPMCLTLARSPPRRAPRRSVSAMAESDRFSCQFVAAEANATGVDQDSEGDHSATNYVSNNFPAAATDGAAARGCGASDGYTRRRSRSRRSRRSRPMPMLWLKATAQSENRGPTWPCAPRNPVTAEADATGVEQEAEDSLASTNEVDNGGEISAWAQAEADAYYFALSRCRCGRCRPDGRQLGCAGDRGRRSRERTS